MTNIEVRLYLLINIYIRLLNYFTTIVTFNTRRYLKLGPAVIILWSCWHWIVDQTSNPLTEESCYLWQLLSVDGPILWLFVECYLSLNKKVNQKIMRILISIEGKYFITIVYFGSWTIYFLRLPHTWLYDFVSFILTRLFSAEFTTFLKKATMIPLPSTWTISIKFAERKRLARLRLKFVVSKRVGLPVWFHFFNFLFVRIKQPPI